MDVNQALHITITCTFLYCSSSRPIELPPPTRLPLCGTSHLVLLPIWCSTINPHVSLQRAQGRELMLCVQAGAQASFGCGSVWQLEGLCLLHHLEENNSKAIVEWNIWLLPVLTMAFSKQQIYFPLGTPQPSYLGTPILSVRDKITKTAPSSRSKQPMENWFQGRRPISLKGRKSAHIYAWLLKWTALLLLLICSQRSILSVGTPGGSHAGTGQGRKKNTPWTYWMGQKILLQFL